MCRNNFFICLISGSFMHANGRWTTQQTSSFTIIIDFKEYLMPMYLASQLHIVKAKRQFLRVDRCKVSDFFLQVIVCRQATRRWRWLTSIKTYVLSRRFCTEGRVWLITSVSHPNLSSHAVVIFIFSKYPSIKFFKLSSNILLAVLYWP